MSIAEVLGRKIKNALDSVAEYNKAQAELTRLRLMLKSETGRLNRAYIELGKDYYNLLKKESNSKYAELLNTVDDADKKIDVIRDRYTKIKNSTNKNNCCCDDECCDDDCSTKPEAAEPAQVMDTSNVEVSSAEKPPRKSIRTVIVKHEIKAEETPLETTVVESKVSTLDAEPDVKKPTRSKKKHDDILVDDVNTDGEAAED